MKPAQPLGDLHALFPKTTRNPAETLRLGQQLALRLPMGRVIGLYGDLGAGKTQLVKGICSGLGFPAGQVHSPTFTLVNEYQSPQGTIYHFDAYRIKALSEFYDLGYEDYFFSDALCLVEWADRIDSLIPGDGLRIRLTHLSETERHFELDGRHDTVESGN